VCTATLRFCGKFLCQAHTVLILMTLQTAVLCRERLAPGRVNSSGLDCPNSVHSKKKGLASDRLLGEDP
jgi:hypothetical protein